MLHKVISQEYFIDNTKISLIEYWGVDYNNSLDNNSKIRASTGVAASWQSPLGPMTFVFSQTLQKADTDTSEGFSFNLGTTF